MGFRATRRNLATLIDDGIVVVGPTPGEMAEAGEAGIGRMAEPLEIVAAALPLLARLARENTLAGRRVIAPVSSIGSGTIEVHNTEFVIGYAEEFRKVRTHAVGTLR